MFYAAYYQAPIGKLTLASDGNNLTGLWLENQKYYAATTDGELCEKADLPVFATVRKWLDAYFRGENPAISDLPLAPKGSAFRQEVWEILCKIPKGEVMTYGGIAALLARKKGRKAMSAQAVGGAVGHNPISVIIPCHRVVGSNGSLTGYAGGLDVKIKLLKHEGVNMSSFFRPTKGTAL